MSGWHEAMKGVYYLVTRAGVTIGRSFHAFGLRLSVRRYGEAEMIWVDLEPADALALADAIKREYGGRDE